MFNHIVLLNCEIEQQKHNFEFRQPMMQTGGLFCMSLVTSLTTIFLSLVNEYVNNHAASRN